MFVGRSNNTVSPGEVRKVFDVVVCRLCDSEFSEITNTHLKYKHNITVDEYLGMFPGAELVSSETRRSISVSMTGVFVGRVLGLEHAQRVSEHWNNKDYRRSSEYRERCEAISKSKMGQTHSPESREGESRSQKEAWALGNEALTIK